jgi:hypothetical protein
VEILKQSRIYETLKNRQVTDAYEFIKQDMPDELPSLFAPKEDYRMEAERIIYKRLEEMGNRQI